MALIKKINQLKSITYITILSSFFLVACEDNLKKDQTMICTLSAKEETGAEEMLQDFYPTSPEGKELKRTLQESDASAPQIMKEIKAKLVREGAPFTCPAFDTLTERVEREAELTAALNTCVEMKGSLDALAMVLPPLFEAEIPKLIQDTIPEEKREDVSRIFNQELKARLDVHAKTPDTEYEALRQKILTMAGCPKGDAPSDGSNGALKISFPPDHKACAEIQQTLPGLTRNRRVILIGEAYGEALMQSGLDPSQYTGPLQERLIALAKQDAIRALEPHVKKLGEQTRCQFR